MTGVLEPSFKSVLNQTDLCATDGMPLVWAARWLSKSAQGRVYGPDSMLLLCEQAARFDHRIFLYGGRDETLWQLSGVLRKKFPDLQIAGAYAPPFRTLSPAEDDACMSRIRESEADIVFVGIGCPKQERWMAEHKDKLPGVVLLGVGAAFDFHCGRVRQSPSWMQEAGLEWLFRLCMEPMRLWRRYLLLNPLFVALWTLQMLGLLRYRLEDTSHAQVQAL